MHSMRNKQSLCRAAFRFPFGDTVLIYRLTVQPAPVEERGFGDGKVFSLSITQISGGGRKKLIKSFFDISRTQKEGIRIFKAVSHCRLMPSNADEIISDIIGIY